ncbi:helix-turn-helix transcriptional regulator [Streptomyces sp. NPDC059697]|uniref:helix-turn-helix transcriptional regulator n=1 Tax=Streptomyces sp. NPDC059697 TaxID=3346912 RepID=UPI003699B4C9
MPSLLRVWRLEAGLQMERGKALSQKEVAQKAGVSERWYRTLESGADVSLPPNVLDRLVETLRLGPDERMAIYAHALSGSTLTRPYSVESGSKSANLEELVEWPPDVPAYLMDHTWTIIGHNALMALWFPWVTEPSPNLLRWVLTTSEAREQLLDWHDHVEHYLGQLRFSLVNWPADPVLNELLEQVLAIPECERIWKDKPRVVAYRQGHQFRVRVPSASAEEVTVSSQVLLPASHPGWRFVILMLRQDGSR